jgi:hypothetical protein
MKEEIKQLYREYCDFIENYDSRSDIGVDRKEEVKGSFKYFMKWLNEGSLAYFND